ncbi:LytR/AlgR family response regulator transcription factor [Arsenicicoccus dermatophilus]|uniref:LytR/AlgR family response regulator transcription factor n=1 Tax=Arsenicicoccus dermatophilus TaxID=1076331 RepID=UPI003916F7D9
MSAPTGTAAVPPLLALVVDDEPPAREDLAHLLAQDERIGEVLLAGSGAEALATLARHPVDVLLCDVSMPGLSGLDVARAVAAHPEPPAVIFVTAHDAHAVDAFELRATDYVLKPVREERLAEAVRRVVATRPTAGSGGEVAADRAEGRRATGGAPPRPTLAARGEALADETIPVELAGVTTFVRRSSVLYAQAQGDYTRLHTRDSNHLVRIPLSTLEERWAPAGFARIHRSTLVSLRHVTQVRTDHGRCTVLLGAVELQVARRHARELRDLLGRPGDMRRREAR